MFTDVMMANMMGSHAVWVKDGVVPDHGIVGDFLSKLQSWALLTIAKISRFEKGICGYLLRKGYAAPDPRSDFE